MRKASGRCKRRAISWQEALRSAASPCLLCAAPKRVPRAPRPSTPIDLQPPGRPRRQAQTNPARSPPVGAARTQSAPIRCQPAAPLLRLRQVARASVQIQILLLNDAGRPHAQASSCRAHKDAQRRGIGRRLVEQRLKWMRISNVGRSNARAVTENSTDRAHASSLHRLPF